MENASAGSSNNTGVKSAKRRIELDTSVLISKSGRIEDCWEGDGGWEEDGIYIVEGMTTDSSAISNNVGSIFRRLRLKRLFALTTDTWTSIANRSYNALTATSAPSERIFSAAGIIVSKKRNRASEVGPRLSTCFPSAIMVLHGTL